MITSFFAGRELVRTEKSDNFLTRFLTSFQNPNTATAMKGSKKRIASQKREEGADNISQTIGA